jgi:hypothetical protein
MKKRDVVALAEVLRIHNQTAEARTEFTRDHLRVLADFCAAQYPDFNRERWIDYIADVDRDESRPKSGKIGPRFIANPWAQRLAENGIRFRRPFRRTGPRTPPSFLRSPRICTSNVLGRTSGT